MTSQETPQTAEEQVLNNNFLLDQIIQHVCVIPERLKLEAVSHQFRNSAKRASWRIPHYSFAQMSIRCQENSSRIHLTHGWYCKFLDGLTRTARQLLPQVDHQQLCQPAELMQTLANLLISKSMVKEVQLGGLAKFGNLTGTEFEPLIVTKDLIQHLDHYANLKMLTFEKVEIDIEMDNFVTSENCYSKTRVTDLRIIDSEMKPGIVEFVGMQTKKVSVKTLEMSRLLPLIEKLDKMDLHLDTLSIQIGTCNDEIFDKSIITRSSEKCERLEIKFVLLDCQKKSQFRALIMNIPCWSNITTLEIVTKSDASEDADDMRIIFEKIGELHHLEKLSISEFINEDVLLVLGRSLRKLKNLKCFHYSDGWSKKSEIIAEFYTYLPKSLTELSLDAVLWKEDNLESLHQCTRSNLKKLKIKNVQKGGMDNFEIFRVLVDHLPELQTFRFCEPLPWQAVRYVNNHPNLTEFQIFTTSSWPDAVTTTLKRNFEDVFLRLALFPRDGPSTRPMIATNAKIKYRKSREMMPHFHIR